MIKKLIGILMFTESTCLLIYWLSGGNFERTPILGFAVFMGILSVIPFAVYLSKDY